MKQIKELRPLTKNIKGVFFDIDDTFSTNGKILPQAYNALWLLKQADFKVVPVTGRPAGWCDHIARMWPVDAIVGENGAFYFRFDNQKKKLQKVYMKSREERESDRVHILKIQDEILKTVAGTDLASDQIYREADLAVDFCEDIPHIGWDNVKRICDIFHKHHATCKVSSIHVNGWFGSYTKLEMVKKLCHDLWDITLDEEKDHYLYLGDSPNDESMFEYFPMSVGVKNVLDFSDQITAMPRYVTSYRGGEGFAEAIDILLQNR